MKRLSITIEWGRDEPEPPEASAQGSDSYTCLLYTSDAADE